jgi:hypothetical protein
MKSDFVRTQGTVVLKPRDGIPSLQFVILLHSMLPWVCIGVILVCFFFG